MTEVNKNQIILDMCMTHRHDFGLDAKDSGFGLPSAGMTDQQRESLRRDMEQLYEHHFDGVIAVQAARIAELEAACKRAEQVINRECQASAAYRMQALELERECERLRERLEINSQCPYDGIATRDITIEVLEREIDRFKEANQRLSEEALNRRNSAVEARRSASDLMAANMGLWAEAEDAKAERDTLRAELEACRKDAERWRYFRDRLGEPVDSDVFSAFNAWLWAEAPIEDVEAAIDAAMQGVSSDASS